MSPMTKNKNLRFYFSSWVSSELSSWASDETHDEFFRQIRRGLGFWPKKCQKWHFLGQNFMKIHEIFGPQIFGGTLDKSGTRFFRIEKNSDFQKFFQFLENPDAGVSRP